VLNGPGPVSLSAPGVNADGSVTYVSATGGTVTLGGWEHGFGFGHGFWQSAGSGKGTAHASSSTPTDGFLARLDGTRLMVWVRLAQVPNSTDYALLAAATRAARARRRWRPPAVNTKVLPGANQPGDHNGDKGKHGGSQHGGSGGSDGSGFGGFGSHG
jgi:hypothetical protein